VVQLKSFEGVGIGIVAVKTSKAALAKTLGEPPRSTKQINSCQQPVLVFPLFGTALIKQTLLMHRVLQGKSE